MQIKITLFLQADELNHDRLALLRVHVENS